MPRVISLLALSLALASCANPAATDDDVGAAVEGLFSANGSVAAEATIFEEQGTENAGGYSDICIGNLATTGTTRRAYVRYNLPAIPATATITRVRLTFTQEVVRIIGGPLTATMRLNRALSSWSEGTGTSPPMMRSCAGGADVPGLDWNGAPSVSGTTSGEEFLPSSNGEVIVFDTDVGTNDDQLISDVQGWVSSGSNFGWRVRVTGEGTVNNARALRPGTLTVYWTLANGGTCTTDSDCASNNCVHPDGNNCGGRSGCVCCNASTCNDDCESCHNAGSVGTCTPRSAGTICRSPSCSGGVETEQGTCNGSARSCPAPVMNACTPFVCAGTACRTSCSSASHCVPSAFCNGSNLCESVSDECAQGLDDCVRLATCSDPTAALNDYVCTCPSGYSGNGRASGTGCRDIDECRVGTAGCDRNATCRNTAGGFTCTCNGPQWVGNGFTCTDYDECSDPAFVAMCSADGYCINRVPGFECRCLPGFRGDGATCLDVDECAEGRDNCGVNAVCTNLSGTFDCSCAPGYMGDGVSCVDVDECANPFITSMCSSVARCVNSAGSFACVCDPGFTGDGFTCTDVDECADGSHECDANATCTNNNGGYTCACNEHWDGSGFECVDRDECALGVDGCAANEVCVNNLGAPHECRCRPGFERPSPDAECETLCGDGAIARGEECDDGNDQDGDGCDAACAIEPGWACYEPTGGASECEETCGDGLIDAAEECDLGPDNSDTEIDGCRTNCRRAGCGDGVVDTGETCDDGDANSDEAVDACRTTCEPAFCGDGVRDTGEACDPGGGAALPDSACAGGCVADGGPDGGTGPTDGGCSCRASGAPSSGHAGWLLGLALLAVRRRRRS